MNLALIGMPGCGKSTVGRHLARHLGLRFVDADTELESRIGMPIRPFFETHGEAAFRDEEQALIEDLSHGQGLLIATVIRRRADPRPRQPTRLTHPSPPARPRRGLRCACENR